jgi:hypothetical protein
VLDGPAPPAPPAVLPDTTASAADDAPSVALMLGVAGGSLLLLVCSVLLFNHAARLRTALARLTRSIRVYAKVRVSRAVGKQSGLLGSNQGCWEAIRAVGKHFMAPGPGLGQCRFRIADIGL